MPDETTTATPIPLKYFVLEGGGGRLNFVAQDDDTAIQVADKLPNMGQRGPDGHVALWRENAEAVTLAAASRGGVTPS